MSVASACNFHENKLLLENDTGGMENEENQSMNNQEANCLDNARVNPTKRTVQHWFDVWRKSQWGRNDGSDLKQVCISTYSNKSIFYLIFTK